MKAPTNTETRFTAEWEPEVHLESQGPNRKDMRRKIVNKGIYRIELDEQLEEALDKLRKGYEVRFTRNDEDALRLYEVVDRECKVMTVVAQTMGIYRQLLRHLKLKRFIRKGEKIKESAARAEIAETKKVAEERVNVSPDSVVKCPKCGNEFRVGKKLK